MSCIDISFRWFQWRGHPARQRALTRTRSWHHASFSAWASSTTTTSNSASTTIGHGIILAKDRMSPRHFTRGLQVWASNGQHFCISYLRYLGLLLRLEYSCSLKSLIVHSYLSLWQVYDTTCHMTGIWQSYTQSKLSWDSRWSGWKSFDGQFEPCSSAMKVVPLWCSLGPGCSSESDGRIHQ
jgi:hypothetical protein